MTPDEDSMLDPEEYTVSVEYLPMPTEQVFITETVRRAIGGDPEAVATIYTEFASAIDLLSEKKWSAAVPWAYVRFVADRLRAVLDSGSKPADVALALGIPTGKAGRPKVTTKYDHQAIAACYFRLQWAGIEPKAATAHMNERIGVSDEVIAKAAEDYAGLEHPDQFKADHPDMHGTYLDALEQLAAPYGQIIGDIIALEKSRPD